MSRHRPPLSPREEHIRSLCRRAAEAAAYAFGVPVRAVQAPRRGPARVAGARQAAMYLSHTLYGLSLTAVGRAFKRDRTTAAHACRLIEERRERPAFDRLLHRLEAECRHARADDQAGSR